MTCWLSSGTASNPNWSGSPVAKHLWFCSATPCLPASEHVVTRGATGKSSQKNFVFFSSQKGHGTLLRSTAVRGVPSLQSQAFLGSQRAKCPAIIMHIRTYPPPPLTPPTTLSPKYMHSSIPHIFNNPSARGLQQAAWQIAQATWKLRRQGALDLLVWKLVSL